MSTEQNQDVPEGEVNDAFAMSDEEFMESGYSDIEHEQLDQTEGEDESASEAEADDINTDESESTDEQQQEEDTDEESQEEDQDSETDEEEQDSSDDADDEESEQQDADEKSEIDYKAEYEKLFTPFKANGREIKVKSAEDAIALMQQGANYNKKMAGLKPNLKLMRMLDNNGLLDENKLSYLIDLDKKDPSAIKKLVKDADIDVFDLENNESEYKPNSYKVDDKEMALNEALDEIKDSETYSKTINIVGSEWDAASQTVISQHPQTIKVINDHVANGIYDQIQTEIDNQRMLGKLSGLSDIEAYRTVGDELHANGAFEPDVPEVEEPVAKPKPKPQTTNRKKAAASTSSKPASKQSSDFNPLSLSDEEFMKQFSEGY